MEAITWRSRSARWLASGLPGCDLRSRAIAQLAQDAFDVPFRGALADHELLADLLIRETMRDERGDLALSRRQWRMRFRSPRRDLRGDLYREDQAVINCPTFELTQVPRGFRPPPVRKHRGELYLSSIAIADAVSPE